MKLVYRVPVVLAVLGCYLNTADLLASFQPPGREWVGWIGAASLAVGLLISAEELAKRGASGSVMLIAAVIGFGFAELASQVLHSAMVRNDTSVLNDTWRWILSYISPSVPVLVGISMPFIVRFGGLNTGDVQEPLKAAIREVLAESPSTAQASGGGSGADASRHRARVTVPVAQLPLPIAQGTNGNGKHA